MELLFGILATGCMGYLITEVNDMQRRLEEVRADIIFIQVQLDRRGLTNKLDV